MFEFGINIVCSDVKHKNSTELEWKFIYGCVY